MQKTLSFQVGEKLYGDIHVASETSDSSISDWVRRCCEKELDGYSFVSEILRARPRQLERLLAYVLEIKKFGRGPK